MLESAERHAEERDDALSYPKETTYYRNNAHGLGMQHLSDPIGPNGTNTDQSGILLPSYGLHLSDHNQFQRISSDDMPLDVNQYQLSPQMGNTAVSNRPQIRLNKDSNAPRKEQPYISLCNASSPVTRPSTLFGNGLPQTIHQRRSLEHDTSPHVLTNHQQNVSNEQRQLYNMVIVGAEPDIPYHQSHE